MKLTSWLLLIIALPAAPVILVLVYYGPLIDAEPFTLAFIAAGICLSLLIAFLIGSRSIARPVATLASIAAHWAAGDYAKRIEFPVSGSELGVLAGSLNVVAESVEHREAKLREALA